MESVRSAGASGVVGILSASKSYRDFAAAFFGGSGLPLSLRAPGLRSLARHPLEKEHPFCTLMAGDPHWCRITYRLQRRLENQASKASRTLRGFADICETFVPLRVGDQVICYLHTGQTMLHQPGENDFTTVERSLQRWGSTIDPAKARALWLGVRVIPPDQYEGLVRLIEVFASGLAESANSLVLYHDHPHRPEIDTACAFIEDHSNEEITLKTVASVAGMSANYFSEKFSEVTGIHFVEYVARTRIERARKLLQAPNLRVNEVAFQTGFQSLSQFNRVFRRIEGRAPREYRQQLPAVALCRPPEIRRNA